MNALFVETSALLRLLFREPGFEEIEAAVSSANLLVASRLLRLEAERAVLRASLAVKSGHRIRVELGSRLRAYWPHFDFVELTAEICTQAGGLAPESPLRSLDALHLASYFHLKARISELRMLSFDKRILELV